MNVEIVCDPRAVACRAADLFVSEVASVLARKGTVNVALPTGSTPVGTYQELVRRYQGGKISRDLITRIRTWNLDEYLPDTERKVWRYHEQSYWLFMQRNLFGYLPFADGANQIPDAAADDLEGMCRQYEEGITLAGGLDLALVGIGTNGHVAFNEPWTHADSRTRIVNLTETTVSDNAKKFFGGDLTAVPKRALSMGMGTIVSARKVILIATGHAKVVAIGASVLGPVTGWCPASFFQAHTDCTYIIDTDAASPLLENIPLSGNHPTPGAYSLTSESGQVRSLAVA